MTTIATTAQASLQQLANYYQDNAKHIAITSMGFALINCISLSAFSINPLGALFQGGLTYASLPLINWIFKEANISPEALSAQVASLAIKIFSSIALGIVTTSALGFTIPLGTAVVLNSALIGVLLGGAFAVSVGIRMASGSTLKLAFADALCAVRREGILEFKLN